MEACHFGIAVFEKIKKPDINPNVSLELGYMIARNRECLVLKEKSLRHLGTDLRGQTYREFDSSKIKFTVLGEVADWLREVGVRKEDHDHKVIVFVSYGGQDRCAIAKAITDHLLLQNKWTLNTRVDSRAAFSPSGPAAAEVAIELVQERLKKDWLSGHRPRRAGIAHLFEANLILALDKTVLNRILELFKDYPGRDRDKQVVKEEIREKSRLFSDFFGGTKEDIEDPYLESKAHYERCFDVLNDRISKNFAALAEFLEKDVPATSKVRSVNFGSRHLFGTCEVTSGS